MKLFYRFNHLFFKLFFRVLYKNKIYGKEHICEGAAVLAPNHLSFLDPPLIGVSCPEELNYFAKAKLFQNPLFGYWISKLNAYPIQGDASDLASFKLVLNYLKENKKVIIFPEGKRSADGNLGVLKPGFAMLALRVKCPIIPTYILGTYEIWNSEQKFPKLVGKTVCIFGSPIDVSAFSHLSKKEAQIALMEAILHAWEKLKDWYDQGAVGIPP